MGLFDVFHGDHDHTCLDTNVEPVATRVGPATPNVYGPLPSLNDWLKRVLKRELRRAPGRFPRLYSSCAEFDR